MTDDKTAKADELLRLLDEFGIVIIHPERIFSDWPPANASVEDADDAPADDAAARSKEWHEDAVLNLGMAD